MKIVRLSHAHTSASFSLGGIPKAVDFTEMTILAQQIEQVPVCDLIQHARNPRKGNVDVIVSSIQANGFFAPLVVQRSTMRVLAGNHRLKAACKLEMDTVPVVFVDVDDDRALRILLADNRASDLGANDPTQLAVLLQDIADTGSLLGTCYSADDLAALLIKSEPPAEFAEYDETAADKVKMQTCPSCGHEYPA